MIASTGFEVGKDINISEIKDKFDAVLITIGSEEARDINIPGRNVKGIYPAMDFLPLQNKLI